MKSSLREAGVLSFHLGGHGHQREPAFPRTSGKDDGGGGGDNDDDSCYHFSNFVSGIVLKALYNPYNNPMK